MMKKILTVAAFVAMTAFGATNAFSFCGGSVVYDNDCGSNPRGFSASCCPSGYRVQGVAYNDIKKKDHADAVSAICRSIAKGNDMMPSDFQTHPVTFMCDKTEVLAGIACKDLPKSDGLDGCTAICQKPGSKNLRMVYNNDLASNPRAYNRHTVYLPKRVVGIAYKDRTKGSSTGSDEADCATISVK